jgi:hypothetical protein
MTLCSWTGPATAFARASITEHQGVLFGKTHGTNGETSHSVPEGHVATYNSGMCNFSINTSPVTPRLSEYARRFVGLAQAGFKVFIARNLVNDSVTCLMLGGRSAVCESGP